MSVLWIIVGIVALGVMVLVHEFGHFIVAKLLGVRVEIFSIGFGPRLWGVKRGATDYRLSLLPLGGFVKMAGDNPVGDREGAPDEFLSQNRWRRALIVLAGPATNVLLAVVLLTGLYMVRYERAAYLDEPARLEGVREGSPAAQAGLQAGDTVVALNGEPTPAWEDVQVTALLNGDRPLEVTLRRDGETLTVVVHPVLEGPRQTPSVGWYPFDPIVVTSADPEMPAAQAGLQAGDAILTLGGESTSELGAAGLVQRVQESDGAPLELTIRRREETRVITVSAAQRAWQGQTGYFLGIGIGPRVDSLQLGPVAALEQSLRENLRFASLIFVVVHRLFTGQVSVRTLEGPIGITILSGQAAQVGLGPLLNLVAIVSINLAVLNLLPIPILDGGHLALLAVEGLRRRDLSLGFKERATQLGFMLLLLLFVLIMYNDIRRYFFQ